MQFRPLFIMRVYILTSLFPDTSRIVADSVKAGKPVIVVSLNYRLNIFAFGDGKGGRNLALKDQRLAIDWVRKYIGGFGGDPVSQVCFETRINADCYIRITSRSLEKVPERHTFMRTSSPARR